MGMREVSASEELPELYFADGLPGFPDARRFVLVRLGDLEAANRAAASPDPGALEGLAALRPSPERLSR